MLLAVAAVLTTSVVFAPVATEAFVAPSAIVVQQSVPAPIAGPQPSTPPEMLRNLSMLAPAALADYLVKHPLAVDQLIANPPSAVDVRSWWRQSDVSQRKTLLSQVPKLIGSLEGIPYELRDQVNRSLLQDAETQIRKETATASDLSEQVTARLKMLDSIETALEPTDGRPRSLLTLDLQGQGLAAVVIGDLRSADYISYLVPGMGFTVEGQLGDWVDAAARLDANEREWLTQLGEHDKEVATVAWLGYRTPDIATVFGFDLAREGARAITTAISGLQTMRVADPPFISIVAHSYGSTAALMALTNGDLSVDALAIAGSPGAPTTSVADLRVPSNEVFVASAAVFDPVAISGYLGQSPLSDEFGARKFGVEGVIDPITGTMLGFSLGHNDYFGSGTESMRNFALVAINRGDLVTKG